MAESSFYHSLLFSVGGVVYGLLGIVLLLYYQGLGRKYVKFWMLSLFALSANQFTNALICFTIGQPITSPFQITLAFLEQLSLYFHLSGLLLGIYAATASNKIKNKNIYALFFVSIITSFCATAFYSLDADAVFNRFYLRESFPSFVMGCGFLAAAFYLLNARAQYFSAKVLTVFCFVIGLRYSLFSFLSIIVLTEDWFRYLIDIFIFFDSGADVLLAFTMLIWMQGAERNAAVNAINKAQYLGEHDQLTGVLNREQVMEKLPIVMENSKNSRFELGVFLLDMKRFKFVNDTYGLKAGDIILGEIATRLADSILQPKVIGRLSGDSFVFVIDISDDKQQEIALEHLHGLIARPYVIDDKSVLLQCSIGYCLYPKDGDIAEDLLQKSNLALAQAESQNIPSVQYQTGMQSQGRRLVAREKEIRSGISNKEFILHYQPQLNLLTNRLEGVEALVRWQHPEHGLLAPNEFFDDIDALGLFPELDNYVLDLACQSIGRWFAQYKRRVTVAVNITAGEFQNPKFISKIQALLFKYEIPPTCLELEITENVVITEIEIAMDTIVVLQNMGIKVSIDDFGTGYSSLAYLRKLPIDKIKIDRSFINEVASNDSDLTIVKSMIKLSHGLGKRVLAEGVETEEQLQLLRNIGCDAVQGYYISRPLAEINLTKYLKRK
jgi:diguanylate cyclase (GGDEF)-like protein